MRDDYYDMLGVDEDAPVDDIRSAYRDKRAEAIAINEKAKDKEKEAERARVEAARLNKAWNVLSDPYQRGRYDEERANASESDDDEYEDDDDAPVARTAKTPAASDGKKRSSANERRAARANAKPTVTLPEGMYFPSTKRRLFAMFIDLALLLVLFVGSQLLVVHLEKTQHSVAYKEVTALNKGTGSKSIAQAQKAESAAKKKSATSQEYKDAKQKVDDLNKDLTANQKVLAPTQNLVSGLFFLICLLILAIPSLFGGQTLGKRLQHVRLMRVDGGRPRWTDVFRRYTALVFAAYVLSTVLRSPVGALIVVFVATLWTRNPNQQALQDKFAKTLVLTDIEE